MPEEYELDVDMDVRPWRTIDADDEENVLVESHTNQSGTVALRHLQGTKESG